MKIIHHMSGRGVQWDFQDPESRAAAEIGFDALATVVKLKNVQPLVPVRPGAVSVKMVMPCRKK